MTAEEGVDQRVGQADDLAKGYETSACDLPEGRVGEVFAPEDLPAGDRAFVGTEAFGELTDPPRRGPLPHGADHDDDGSKVDRSAQEAYRRRCRPLPATVAIAAEAQSEALGLRKLGGSPARLALVVGTVEAATTRTALLAGFLREIFVDCQQERPEPGGPGQIVIHGRVLRGCGKLRSTPLGELDPVIRLFEGNFFTSRSDLAQESRNSRRLSWPRSHIGRQDQRQRQGHLSQRVLVTGDGLREMLPTDQFRAGRGTPSGLRPRGET